MYLEAENIKVLIKSCKENNNGEFGIQDDETIEIKFCDLFAGIGGTRLGLELACKDLGLKPKCVFSSEIDRFARKTYKANFGEEPRGDIREIPSSEIPYHDILLAGFPCQPFSIAGVSKRESLNRPHGFACKKEGNLFFEIERILRDCYPEAFILENVKHLKRHDRGRTYRIIYDTLTSKLGYTVFSNIYDAKAVVPQHRERIFIVGFKSDTAAKYFMFPEIVGNNPTLGSILEDEVDPKYVLSDSLWDYLKRYKEKHRQKGNGFGYGLFDREDVARTLSSRYYKDGSEILIRRENGNPRRLTPRECARLMGFPDTFIIPVSDTQAYRQFGNSVVVPVVREVARAVVLAVLRAKEDVPKCTCL